MRRVLLCLVLLALLGGAPPAAGQSLSLGDVQAAYEALEGLQASFTQVLTSDFAGDSTRVEGTVLLSGNKYRVRTPAQTVVTNGTTTWIYTPRDSQVVVNDADTEGAVTPETFLTASGERYAVTASRPVGRDGRPHVRLSITATDSTARFETATLWVRERDRLVTRMRATDRDGSTLDLRLRDLLVNPDTLRSGSPFTFAPPAGVQVVDLRQRK
jgi:outer membrane lipoprotein carrier protein